MSNPSSAVPIFNPDNPHGLITGHDRVRYVQEGQYFTGAGRFVPLEEAFPVIFSEDSPEESDSNSPDLQAALFLKKQLADGPRAGVDLYKTAKTQDISWLRLQEAAARMNLLRTAIGSKKEMWSFRESV